MAFITEHVLWKRTPAWYEAMCVAIVSCLNNICYGD